MKILHNLCLHFVKPDGQDGKNWKENCATWVTKIPKTFKTKRRKYGMNKTLIFKKKPNYLSFERNELLFVKKKKSGFLVSGFDVWSDEQVNRLGERCLVYLSVGYGSR